MNQSQSHELSDGCAGNARLNSDQHHARATLSEQLRRQVRYDRKRMTWWIPWIFVIGFCISALGLFTSITSFREGGSLTLKDIFFAFFFVQFGAAVGLWLTWPFRFKPRIVPYFARELGEYGGKTSAAFARGHGLYREILALDQLASTLGVKPLSAFGFADDYYEQEVQWHAASEGLRTIEVLRQGLGAPSLTAPDLTRDLEALDSVLRAAAEQGVDFSLVLRRLKKDSIQVVSSVECRQGRFW